MPRDGNYLNHGVVFVILAAGFFFGVIMKCKAWGWGVSCLGVACAAALAAHAAAPDSGEAIAAPQIKFIPLTRGTVRPGSKEGRPRVIRPDGFFPLSQATVSTMPRVLRAGRSVPGDGETPAAGARVARWSPAAGSPEEAHQILELFPPPSAGMPVPEAADSDQ